MNEVVVTGRGVISSIGEGADVFLDALSDRRSGVVDGIARCRDFDPERYMTAKEARRADRFTQFAVAAAVQAAEEAGLPGEVDPTRIGIVIGTGVGGLTTLQEQVLAWREGGDRAVSPNFVPMMMPNAASAVVAMRLGARGPGLSVSSACATGTHGIGEGARMIERGDADVVLAGGSEAAITTVCLAAFNAMGALSREGISRPFDVRRDGFVMGEGAAVLVLESAAHAKARGALSRGRIVGYGSSNDAFHITQPDKDGRGATQAMRAALADADAAPADVGYLNAHGTSTPFNDRCEVLAYRQIFGADGPPLSSTKSAIGHLLGAAGAVEAVATLAALERGVMPPTLNYEELDPECDVDVIADGPRDAPGIELALSNSFGFGGQNACLAIGRA
ncbi:MAG: beta-ketoacyl-[acyl-carrier-protein] synthase family protein [Actinomycetota bacterium]